MERYKRGSNLSILWLFILCITEMVLIWAIASQFSYAVTVNGDISAFHLFLVLGVIVIGILAFLTFGMMGINSTNEWNDQRCSKFLGFDTKMVYKNEMLIFSAIVLGTLIGTGVWDVVTTLNALASAGWDLSVFNDDYVVIDFVMFKIVWVLWVHLLVGTVKGGIALVIAIMLGARIKNGKFCEV